MVSKQAINFVNHSLEIGDYGYVLRKYLKLDTWNDLLLDNMEQLVFIPMTDFNYTRCFSYMFMEDINLENSFFSAGSKQEVIDRGFIEFISLRISCISPFFYMARSEYRAEENQLKVRGIEVFQNERLENKMQELMLKLEEEKLFRINYEELNIHLPNVSLEDYEDDRVTYFSYLFE